jgi:hypothetical protein
MNEHLIPVDIYRDQLWLVFPADHKSALAWLHRKGCDKPKHVHELKESDGLSVRTRALGSVIFLTQWKSTPEMHGILAHETLHAARDILNSRGVREKRRHEEATTYLQQFLIERCLNKLTPTKPTTKTK